MHLQSNMKALRTAAPYIRRYRGRIFVIKMSGRLCQPGRVLDNIVEQGSLLYQLGIRLVLVHGGGEQADALCEQLGTHPQTFAGRRITDDQTLEVTKMAFAGTANTDLLAALRKVHVPAVGISGVDGGLLTARRRPCQTVRDPSTGEQCSVDFGHVGDIVEVNAAVLDDLLQREYVPVVCSLGADDNGNVYNINADTVAARIASAVGAAKYFLLTNVDGIMRDRDDPSTLQSYLDLDELAEMQESGVIAGGMLPKIAACVDALRRGVPRVHIINGTTPDTLLGEVFTNEGCGTLLVEQRSTLSPDEQEAVQP